MTEVKKPEPQAKPEQHSVKSGNPPSEKTGKTAHADPRSAPEELTGPEQHSIMVGGGASAAHKPDSIDIGLLAQPMAATDDTTVALANAATTTVVPGDAVTIDAETMAVTDAVDQNNLKVTRGVPSGAHSVGAVVYIQRPKTQTQKQTTVK